MAENHYFSLEGKGRFLYIEDFFYLCDGIVIAFQNRIGHISADMKNRDICHGSAAIEEHIHQFIFFVEPFPIHEEHPCCSVIPGRQYFVPFPGKACIRTIGIIRIRFAPQEQNPFSIYFLSGIIVPADAVILNRKAIAGKYQPALCRMIGGKG